MVVSPHSFRSTRAERLWFPEVDSASSITGFILCHRRFDHLAAPVGRQALLENFGDLIDRLGFIPNGNRIYYENRSSLPFLPT